MFNLPENINNPAYCIYAKTKDMKKFQPLDVFSGKALLNLIYATTWFDKEEEAQKICKELSSVDSDIKFEVRRRK